MLRKIKLYGPLAKFVGKKVLKASVSSAAEAVRFLIVNFQGLERHMMEQEYVVRIGALDIAEEQLHYPAGCDDISFIPVVSGAGGNAGMILTGALLIGLSFTPLGPAAFAGGSGLGLTGIGAGGMYAAGAFGSAILGAVGASLVLGGVSGLLAPGPTVPNRDDDPTESFSFTGVQQTSRAGVAVPVIYGEIMTGSVVISANVTLGEDISVISIADGGG